MDLKLEDAFGNGRFLPNVRGSKPGYNCFLEFVVINGNGSIDNLGAPVTKWDRFVVSALFPFRGSSRLGFH